jgi:hypothetical protein
MPVLTLPVPLHYLSFNATLRAFSLTIGLGDNPVIASTIQQSHKQNTHARVPRIFGPGTVYFPKDHHTEMLCGQSMMEFHDKNS